MLEWAVNALMFLCFTCWFHSILPPLNTPTPYFIYTRLECLGFSKPAFATGLLVERQPAPSTSSMSLAQKLSSSKKQLQRRSITQEKQPSVWVLRVYRGKYRSQSTVLCCNPLPVGSWLFQVGIGTCSKWMFVWKVCELWITHASSVVEKNADCSLCIWRSLIATKL